jgi:hypothetical protein
MGEDKFPRFSDMDFIPESTYAIEESRAFASVGNNVRTVEFVRMKDDKLLFVEARKTIANPDNSPEPYKREVYEICEKFIHSLNLFAAVEIGIIEDTVPEAFHSCNIVSLMFVLVVRNHKPKWCRPIKRELEQQLPAYLKKIWRPTVYVINYETAKKLELVS